LELPISQVLQSVRSDVVPNRPYLARKGFLSQTFPVSQSRWNWLEQNIPRCCRICTGNEIEIELNPLKIMTLTKRDLVVRISEETGLVQQQVLEVVQKTLDYISEALAKGNDVELRNFGVFEVKIRKARVGRNPNKPETDVPIPARSVVKFKPGKEMREQVIKLSPKA
jgi:nucleoid DNA-binding protein